MILRQLSQMMKMIYTLLWMLLLLLLRHYKTKDLLPLYCKQNITLLGVPNLRRKLPPKTTNQNNFTLTIECTQELQLGKHFIKHNKSEKLDKSEFPLTAASQFKEKPVQTQRRNH